MDFNNEETRTPVEETCETTAMGVVTNCSLLNLRMQPKEDAPVICTLCSDSVVMIFEEKSTEDYYKVCTPTGLEGFCMKKYIAINRTR